MEYNSSENHILRSGVSVFGKHTDDPVRLDPLFDLAKTGDYEAARQLVEKLWTDDKTEELRRLILPERPPIFFSVPSTSRTNQLPIAYAKFLAEQTQDLGATYLVGDEHISSLHTSMMKSLKKSHRLMAPRLYETFHQSFFDNFRPHTQNASVVLVEDIITTGSSVNAFRRFLEHNGVPVDYVVGIRGDTNLDPSPSELTKLERTAKKAGLDTTNVDYMALGRELTSSEVMTLASHYIGTQYKKADEQTRLLMRRQLYYLYVLRVCRRAEVSTKINKLNRLIDRREERSHA
ncbi:MAG: hypothetical protein IJV75_06640 [Alphaproteobacteria bacterium]|nr:hypothetical protein [Alphaproteobacteria bacterium]